MVPPPQVFFNFQSGYLDGYCAGEPWNALSVLARVGWVVATSADLAPLHPEKVLMVRRDFADARTDEHRALIAALLEACRYCDAPENRERIMETLAEPRWIGAPIQALRMSMAGHLRFRPRPRGKDVRFHGVQPGRGQRARPPRAPPGCWGGWRRTACCRNSRLPSARRWAVFFSTISTSGPRRTCRLPRARTGRSGTRSASRRWKRPSNIFAPPAPTAGWVAAWCCSVAGERVVRVGGDKAHPANFGALCTKGSTVEQTLRSGDRLRFAQRRQTGLNAGASAMERDSAGPRPANRGGSFAGRSSPNTGRTPWRCTSPASFRPRRSTSPTNSAKGSCAPTTSTAIRASAWPARRAATSSPSARTPRPGITRISRAPTCFLSSAPTWPSATRFCTSACAAGCGPGKAKLIVADPRRTATAAGATLYLPLKPGSDLALLNGLLHLLVKAGRIDSDFIARHTEGWEDVEAIDRRLTRPISWPGSRVCRRRTSSPPRVCWRKARAG